MENRIIKFRGKRKGGTEWIYGDLNHIDGKVYVFDRSEMAPLNSPDWFEVEPETVGQYSALKDKNGKEIYEGDILEDDRYGYKREVKWEMSCGGCCSQVYGFSASGDGHTDFIYLNENEIKVIGNIFENPELLTH